MISAVPTVISTTMPTIRTSLPFSRPEKCGTQQRQEHEPPQQIADLGYHGAEWMSNSICSSRGQSAETHGTRATGNTEQEPAGVVLATKSRYSDACTELAESTVKRVGMRELIDGNTLESSCASARATNSISDARTSIRAQVAAEICASTLGMNSSALSLALPGSIESNIADARISGSPNMVDNQKTISICSVDFVLSGSSYHFRNGLQLEKSSSDTQTDDEHLSRIKSLNCGRAARQSCLATLNKTERSTVVDFASPHAVTTAPLYGSHDEGKTFAGTFVSAFDKSSTYEMTASHGLCVTSTTDHASNYSRSAALPTTSPSLLSSSAPKKRVVSWVMVMLYVSILYILQLMTITTFNLLQ